MKRFTAALLVTGLALAHQPLHAAARVTVAHFAPFADPMEGTAGDIAINGSVDLTDVGFTRDTE